MNQFADGIFQRYDTNKSGVFEKDEWKNFRTDPTPWDYNKDGKITRDELVKDVRTLVADVPVAGAERQGSHLEWW